jgi:O-antigen ligase
MTARLANVLLFVVLLRVLGVLPPDYNPTDFDKLNETIFTVETASADLFNQLFWLTTSMLASLLIASDPERLGPYLRGQSLLLVLLAFCIVSALWATHPWISLRRSLLLVLGAYSVLGGVAYSSSVRNVLGVVYSAFAVVLLLNLASLVLPTAFDQRGLMRGIAGDKNYLGVVSAFGVLVGVAARPTLRTALGRALNLGFVCGFAFILALTGSKTAMALTVLAPALALALWLGVRGLGMTLTTLVALVMLAGVSVLVGLTLVLGIEVNDLLALPFGDATFTGRDAIWGFIIEQWKSRPALGFGYGSFWGVGFESPNLGANYPFIRLLTQSHNGYLDVALSIGVLGLAIVLACFAHTLALIERAEHAFGALFGFCLAAFIFILIHNLMESSLLRGVATPWIVYLLMTFTLVKAMVEVNAVREGESSAAYEEEPGLSSG